MFRINTFPRRSLQWWISQQSVIDFSPDFQRTARVWTERDKRFLIDSILNGFDIPKLYVADFTTHDIPALNKKEMSYAIIDGKQRLTTILAFREDRLALSKNFYHSSVPGINLGGLVYSELKRDHPLITGLFDRYALDVKSIETDDRAQINDVFLRLNKASKALNGAEVRNAMIGKAVDAIRDISHNNFLKRRINFTTDRSQEKNAAAKVLALEYAGGPAETKKKNLDALVVAVGETGNRQFGKTVKRVKEHLQNLSSVFQNQDRLLSTQGSVPLYYLFVSRLHARDRKHVRVFLEEFEKARTKNRNRTPGTGDYQLDQFDLVSRSTNDKSSYTVRLRVLRSKFGVWRRRH
ncbi:MAG: DUF262 domain-containing protein [Gemmatimonadales bacterium]|nr:DUF262 domain-containing protein [Gemmatimonadales bacterium]